MNTDDRLEARLGQALLARGLMFCAAESCTGGLVLHRMTNIPGSSAYVVGGVVAYANEVKQALLGVRESTLIAHGAVSEPVVREMAAGALRVFGAGLAVAITGIAGPGGATAEKPVGLTYIACATADGVQAERHVWPGDREAVKWASADAVLRLALAAL